MTDGGSAAEGPFTDRTAAEGAPEVGTPAGATVTHGTAAEGAPEVGTPAGATVAPGPAAEGAPAKGTGAEDNGGASRSHPVSVSDRRRRIVLITVIAAAVLAADQVTKSLVVEHLSDHRVHLIGPFFLALSYNTGVAFSVGAGLTLPIILIAVAVVGSIVWLARGSLSSTAAVAVGLILGGALGNLSDRLFRAHRGAVIDFLYSGFWPTFNIADSCIVVGSFLLAFSLWRKRAP